MRTARPAKLHASAYDILPGWRVRESDVCRVHRSLSACQRHTLLTGWVERGLPRNTKHDLYKFLSPPPPLPVVHKERTLSYLAVNHEERPRGNYFYTYVYSIILIPGMDSGLSAKWQQNRQPSISAVLRRAAECAQKKESVPYSCQV